MKSSTRRFNMNKKRVLVIPSRTKFEKVLGIRGRKINVGIFITNEINKSNDSLMESALYQLRYLNIINWVTNYGRNQSGSKQLMKLHELYSKDSIDLVICFSKKDIEGCMVELESSGKPMVEYDVPYYCVNDCVLVKEDQVICLS
jgi:hypothetical protein